MNNIEKMCRICLNVEDTMNSLFSVDDDFVEYNIKLYSCIPSIQIDQFNFPTLICEPCINNLRQAYNFRKLCIKSTLKLFKYVNNEKPSSYEDFKFKIIECVGAVESDDDKINTGEDIELLINDACAKINGDIDINEQSTSTPDISDIKEEEKESSEKSFIEENNTNTNDEVIYTLSDDSDLELPYVCLKCNNGFSTMKALSEHLQTHLVSNTEFKCEICNKEFVTVDNLNSHICKGWLQCSFCYKSFKSSAALFSHKYHKHVKPHICPVCGKKLSNSKILQQHIRLHSYPRSKVLKQ